MTSRFAHAFWKCCRACLLVGVSLGAFGHDASAETIAHLTRTVWGCVDPNVAPSINDASNPRHLDPQWVIKTIAEGKCVTLAPGGNWAILSHDYNGLTYVGARGTAGPSGSFWVPTSALVADPPSALPTAPPLQVITKPPPTETSTAQKPKQATVEHYHSKSDKKNPTDAVLPTPSADVPAPTPSQPASQAPSSQGNGMGGWVLFTLVALTAFGMLRRSWSRRKRTSNARPETQSGNLTNTTAAVSSVDFRIHPSSLVNSRMGPTADATRGRSKRPKTPATDHARTIIPSVDFRIRGEPLTPQVKSTAGSDQPAKETWYPPGTPISVGRATISDGMVYICHAAERYMQHDGCFIDPSLSVGSSAVASSLGYWPSYQRITPDCRQRYLEWLASGKKAPGVDIGYVFLYFYGLERRLLVDEPSPVEIDALVEELKRLRTIYSANGSFDGYSRRLVEAVDFLRNAGDVSRLFIPDLTAPFGDMPVPLKVAIAREVVAGRPLVFEHAAAALLGLREFWMTCRPVLDKGRQPFLAVLRARFEATFPSGFILRNRKGSSLQLV